MALFIVSQSAIPLFLQCFAIPLQTSRPVIDSSRPAVRMLTVPITHQATAATAMPVSMEMDAIAFPMVSFVAALGIWFKK